ncbi:MAG: CDP-alcohol phosphatidyltransferase family protein [Oscillospiraceae bacterium]|nr:CDP-alcohol phosphatidyltransferase family protein [Oscillospiraceae bacterium]
MKDWKKELLTIPNLLSLFRLVLIPVYVAIYINATQPDDYFVAAAILAVSCLTDLIDGKIARHFNMISTVGKILDPLADKATQFTLIVCLAMKHDIIWYMVALFFIKELFQLIAGLVTIRNGKMLRGALITGKVCTTILFISLIIMVLMPALPEKIITIITIIDIGFLLISFIDYIATYLFFTKRFEPIEKPTIQ